MQTPRLLPLLALLMAVSPSSVMAAEPDSTPIDLLAFSNGALIERVSSTYGSGWEALWLLDEAGATGWANEDGKQPPFEIVVSVPERSSFTGFAFDTARTESPERSAKTVAIAVSDQSANGGFAPVATAELEPAADNQQVSLAAPVVGRWIKFTVIANHGDPQYWEIMNVHGFGAPLTSTPLPLVSGTYDSREFGRFHLLQSGAQLAGCYEHKHGLIQGGLEAHLMRLTWTENDGADHGPALMVRSRDGSGFTGLWRTDGDQDGPWNGQWDLKKISSDVGACSHWRPAGGQSNLIATSLAQAGRVRLYGIGFDTDSDRLRPDAAPTLEQIAAALKANAGWMVTVEGHTDSTSTPAHNQDLSTRRAAAVKAYLVAAGIAPARLNAAGFGQDKPVAANDTAIGRAQNRRVEIVRE